MARRKIRVDPASGPAGAHKRRIRQVIHPAMTATDSARRRNRRYISLTLAVAVLIGGWSAFWFYAAGVAQKDIAGWRAREAKAGRVYGCGEQTLRGFPFRVEVDCTPAAATVTSGGTAFTFSLARALAVLQIYQPDLVIGEFHGPLSFGEKGKPASVIANWKQAEASVAGTPAAPKRAAFVFDRPVVSEVDGGKQVDLLRAEHLELHGRIVGGSVWDKPVLELALTMTQAALPTVRAAATAPVDGEIVATLRGLKDFSPKPWAARFREMQAAGGTIEIERARLKQGDTLAVGAGKLSLNAQGYLQGTLNVTASGLEHYLNAIGADMAVKNSPAMDKVAGFLDKLAPGLGNVARQEAGAHITFGIKAIEGNATLEGKPAVTLPLTFDNGAVSLGPIPLGHTPALF